MMRLEVPAITPAMMVSVSVSVLEFVGGVVEEGVVIGELDDGGGGNDEMGEDVVRVVV